MRTSRGALVKSRASCCFFASWSRQQEAQLGGEQSTRRPGHLPASAPAFAPTLALAVSSPSAAVWTVTVTLAPGLLPYCRSRLSQAAREMRQCSPFLSLALTLLVSAPGCIAIGTAEDEDEEDDGLQPQRREGRGGTGCESVGKAVAKSSHSCRHLQLRSACCPMDGGKLTELGNASASDRMVWKADRSFLHRSCRSCCFSSSCPCA